MEREKNIANGVHKLKLELQENIISVLKSLETTKNQLVKAEPVSDELENIKKQIDVNNSILEDLAKSKIDQDQVKRSAEDIITEFLPQKEDPFVKEIKQNVDQMSGVCAEIQDMARKREKNIAEGVNKYKLEMKENVSDVLNSLDDIKNQLSKAEPVSNQLENMKNQMYANNAILEDLARKKMLHDQFKKSTKVIIDIALNKEDSFVMEIQKNIDRMLEVFSDIQEMIEKRQKKLEEEVAKLKLEMQENVNSILNFLNGIKDHLTNAEPVSPLLEVIKKQADSNNDIMNDLAMKKFSFEEVKKSAKDIIQITPHMEDLRDMKTIATVKKLPDIIQTTPMKEDPIINDVNSKIDKLNNILHELEDMATKREQNLAAEVAKFPLEDHELLLLTSSGPAGDFKGKYVCLVQLIL